MLLIWFAIFVLLPVLCHFWFRDIPSGSAAAGLLIGATGGAAALWTEGSVLLGLIVFLFGSCVGFGLAYGIGWLLRMFGLAEASTLDAGR